MKIFCIDGVDGVGKSYLCRKFVKEFNLKLGSNLHILSFHELHDSEKWKTISSLPLLDDVFKYTYNRKLFYEDLVKKFNDHNCVILIERGFLSTLIYQDLHENLHNYIFPNELLVNYIVLVDSPVNILSRKQELSEEEIEKYQLRYEILGKQLISDKFHIIDLRYQNFDEYLANLVIREFHPFNSIRVKLISESKPFWDVMSECKNWYRKDSVGLEDVVEFAGRVCYDSFSNPRPGGYRAYIENIVKQRHFSVLEHVNFTIFISGISRACSHELVRHRHFSFSQRSQRYCDESNNDFLKFEFDEKLKSKIEKFFQDSKNLYKEVSNVIGQIGGKTRKEIHQLARYFLPQCATTEIVVTGNVRTWRHFFTLRCNEKADFEIRYLANRIFDILSNRCYLFWDFSRKWLGDGTYSLVSEYTE